MPALAEGASSGDLLAAAEHAYQDVDFASARDLSQHALEAGAAPRQQTARLHVLLGMSTAALGDTAAAKSHFVAALAIDPTLRLDKILSPKIRDPYLEAQGYWSASPERLSVDATVGGDGAHLVIRLHDPAALVAKVELRASAVGAPERAVHTLAPSEATRFALPAPLRGRDYEYLLRALDAHGNVLAERGSEADPVLVHQRSEEAPATGTPRSERSYLLPATLGVAGLGALAAGVVFNVRREQAAQEWNGPRCERPFNLTRQQECPAVSARIDTAERLAIGFYAGGGALVLGGVIALVATGGAPAPAQTTSHLDCSFLGRGVSCQGQF